MIHYALIIGVDTFRDRNVQPLRYACADAQATHEVLSRDLRGPLSFAVIFLTATRDQRSIHLLINFGNRSTEDIFVESKDASILDERTGKTQPKPEFKQVRAIRDGAGGGSYTLNAEGLAVRMSLRSGQSGISGDVANLTLTMLQLCGGREVKVALRINIQS